MLPEIECRGKRQAVSVRRMPLCAFRQRRLDVDSNVLIQLIGDVFAHVSRLGTIVPQYVSSFIVGFFSRAVFQSLMKILVRHKDDDRAKRMIVHSHFVTRGNAAANDEHKFIFKFEMIVFRVHDRALAGHIHARLLRRGIGILCCAHRH
jgi:hypothetical protein